ncbi:unnamed protein product [Rhizoctonia solani]|uniref:Uncharacterized protein n=1 Tax=Rhizoctonia solani TaxID=456999 RepID=A0A8H3BCG1_9AGAM|nr:unnamed protein product [Rhizoctonia solani]
MELRSISLSVQQLKQLINQTALLFIVAILLVQFILLQGPKSTPQDWLKLVLSMTLDLTWKHLYINSLYGVILNSVLGKGLEESKKDCIWLILWTILFAQESIDVQTIAILTGVDDS